MIVCSVRYKTSTMKRLVKYLSLFFTLVLVVICGLVVYILTLDPNQYRDQITELAAGQGIDLRIEGDLGWRLYPQLSLEVEQLSLSVQRPEAGYAADVDRMELLLELWPLLRREFQLRGLNLNGADIRLIQVDPSADSAQLPDEAQEDVPVAETADAPIPVIVAERMHISDSSLRIFSSNGEETLAVTDIELLVENFNLAGDTVSLSGQLGSISTAGESAIAPLRFNVALSLGQDNITGRIQDLSGNLQQTTRPTPLNLQAVFDWAMDGQQFSLTEITGSVGTNLNVNGAINGQVQPVGYAGELQIANTNLRQLLTGMGIEVTQIPQTRLNNLELASDIQGTDASVTLGNLRVQLDESNFQGSVQLGWGDLSQLILNGQLDQVNLDDYLPPPSGDEQITTEGEITETVLIPVLPFNRSEIDLEVRSLQVAELPMQRLRLLMNSNTRQLRLQELSAQLFEGTFNTRATLQLVGELPHQFDIQVANVQIDQFIATRMETASPISGAVSLNLSGLASGAQTSELIRTLEAEGRLQAADLILHGQDVEALVCDISDRIQRRSLQSQYTDMGDTTNFENIDAGIRIQDGVARIQSLRSGVESINIGGDVRFNLEDLSYRLDLTGRIAGERTSVDGCTVNERLRNKEIPLRCTGNAADTESLSCGVPQEFIRDLLAGEVTRQITDRLLGDDNAEGEETENSPRRLIEGLLRNLGN